MSRKNYVINCYTCQHNGQETCKGCNTFLVGKNEPYENWQLREDLEQKDTRIADLEAKLAEKEKELQKYRIDNFGDAVCDFAYGELTKTELWKSIEEQHKMNMVLKQQLAEKDTEIERVKLLLETERVIRKQEKNKLEKAKHDRDRYKKTIAELKQQLVDLQSEQIKEMQEHQEAMKLADKTIKDLEIKLLLKPSFGKFESADELYKSYTNLEKEYTKLRQQFAEKEKEIELLNMQITIKDIQIESSEIRIKRLRDYAEPEMKRIKNEQFNYLAKLINKK